MKRLLATTSVALVIAGSAMAESHMGVFNNTPFDAAKNLYASHLIGMRVYASEADIDNTVPVAADGEKDWNDIGEINDIILTRDGMVQAAIVGVGGFLGMGEKDVAIDMSQLNFVSDGDKPDEFFLVVKASAAGIEEAPAYGADATDTAMATNDTAMDTSTASVDRPRLMMPTVVRDGYTDVVVDDLTTEDLTGARVYGASDEDIGEINSLLLTDDGKMDQAVIDIGGFLGLGEHQIAVTFDELQIVRDDSGDVRVYIDSSQEALEAQPQYQG